MHNYNELYKSPTQEQRDAGLVKTLQLEIMDLSTYECCGENVENLQGSFMTQDEIIKAELNYSCVTTTPVELLSIKKSSLYKYLDDFAMKNFISYLKKLP